MTVGFGSSVSTNFGAPGAPLLGPERRESVVEREVSATVDSESSLTPLVTVNVTVEVAGVVTSESRTAPIAGAVLAVSVDSLHAAELTALA